jgi:hypothetical protein
MNEKEIAVILGVGEGKINFITKFLKVLEKA